MRALPLLAAILVLAGRPSGSSAAEVSFVAASEDRAAPAGTPSGEGACTTSGECAARLGRGNVCTSGRCAAYLDRRDAYDVVGLRKSAPSAPRPLEPLVTVIPTFGYSPASGLLLGVGGTVGLLLGRPFETTMSSATGSLMVTTKKQLLLQLSATTMTAGNSWELQSDLRYLVFNQSTYGLGTGGAPLETGITINGWGELAAVDGAQEMEFDLARIHQNALRRVGRYLFLGAGYRLDRYTKIVDRRLDLSAAPPVVTSHYAYSLLEEFDPDEYTASGLSLEAVSDARDSTIAPYRGWYAHLRFTGYPTWLGSTQSATLAYGEGRAYVGLSDENPRNLLAFWFIAQGVTSGSLPYLALPASGWDPRGTSGRGYVQGRFRGKSMVYAEAEWRFRLTSDGLLGGNVFVNAQTFSRPGVSLPEYSFTLSGEALFDAIKVAGGVGLRVMLMKQSRSALRVDVAGGDRSVAFYLGVGEAF